MENRAGLLLRVLDGLQPLKVKRFAVATTLACSLLFAFATSVKAQTTAPGEWTWQGGGKPTAAGYFGVYGTLGKPAAGNVPGSREGAVSWTDASGQLWLLGGYGNGAHGNDGVYLNDLWQFNPATKKWAWMGGSGTGNELGVYGNLGTPAAGNMPGNREYAVSWTDSSGNLWLFGGVELISPSFGGYLNDLWKFNPSTSQWAWEAGSNAALGSQPGIYGTLGTPAAGNVPGGRIAAVSWTDSSGNLWLFGGAGSDAIGNGGYLNDLWEFNPSTNLWAWIAGSNFHGGDDSEPGVYGTMGTPAPGNTPGGRVFASGWTDANGNLWLFGGYDPTGYLNDLWEFNPSTSEWAWMGGSSSPYQPSVYGTLGVPAPGNAPGDRYSASSWTDNSGNLWLFGGSGGEGDFNELWEFNPSTSEWAWQGGGAYGTGVYGTLGTPAAGNVPGSRYSAVSWADTGGNFWIFGGDVYTPTSGEVLSNDLWEFQPLAPAKATPILTWNASSAITYGTALTGTQLNATTTVAGTFSYSPVAGTVLGAGTQTLSVTFYPTNTNAYTTATATVQLVVNKAVLTVAPAAPAGGASYFTLGYGDRFPYSTDLCQISGFVNGDTLSAVSGSPNPTVSWGSNPTPPVGNYTLSCALGTLAAANYMFSLNSAPETIQVTPGVITIKPYGGAANYGNGRPAIGYEATGLVYGQTAAGVLSGPPIITTTAPAHPNAGTYPVMANVSGLTAANYTVVAGPPGTLTIWPAPLNVTAKNAAVRYGQTLPTTFPYSLVGLRYSDTAAVLTATPSVSTSATNPAAAGAYPINVNLNGATATNYSVNPVNGTLTVLPATLLVLPTSMKAVYGAPLPSFTSTITGFEYSDTAAGVYSGSPSLTSSATQGSPVGEYSINSAPGSLSLISSNYAFSYRLGKLTIDKAPLTVKATSITITQGSAIPTLTYTMAGFVNGDSQASATTGMPTLTTTATSASAPGVYPIKIAVGTLAAGNYGFTFVNGTLTITP